MPWEDEYNRMVNAKVFEVVPEQEVPENATVLSSTWVMKKKANGVYRARVTARGFEQIDGEHYDEDDKAAPVVSDITIRVYAGDHDYGSIHRTHHGCERRLPSLENLTPNTRCTWRFLKGLNASCPRTWCCYSSTRCMELNKQHWLSGDSWR